MTGRPRQNCERNNEVTNRELIEEQQVCLDQLPRLAVDCDCEFDAEPDNVPSSVIGRSADDSYQRTLRTSSPGHQPTLDFAG